MIRTYFNKLLGGVRPAKSAPRNFRIEIANSVDATQEVVEACLSAAARTFLRWCIFSRAAFYAQAMLPHAQAKGANLKRVARQLDAALPRPRSLQLSSMVALLLRSRAWRSSAVTVASALGLALAVALAKAAASCTPAPLRSGSSHRLCRLC